MPNIGKEPSEEEELRRKQAAKTRLDISQEEGPARMFNNNTDDGVIAFALWMNSCAGDESPPASAAVPVSVHTFVPDKLAVLDDHAAGKQVTVEFKEGIPYCKECDDSAECLHVGFAICLEQRHARVGAE
jgi:hypothetical protein